MLTTTGELVATWIVFAALVAGFILFLLVAVPPYSAGGASSQEKGLVVPITREVAA